MAKTIKIADLTRIIKEAVESGVSDTDASEIFNNISKENEKVAKEQYKDGEKRIDDNTPGKGSEKIEDKAPSHKPTDSDPVASGRNALNLKYDSMDDKYQKRVNALVMGKASPHQADIDDVASGVSTTGNKKFYDQVKTDNDGYNKVLDDTFINNRITLPKRSGGTFATENKVRVGDIFIETKNNLELKVTGLTEDKQRVNFIDEKTNKKYSLAVENFKKAVKGKKMISEAFRGPAGSLPQTSDASSPVSSPVSSSEETFMYNGRELTLDDIKSCAMRYAQDFQACNLEKRPEECVGEYQSFIDEFGGCIMDMQENPEMLDEYIYFCQEFKDDPSILENKKSETKPNINEGKTKRLKLNKTAFINEAHVISLIPEQYKKEGSKFLMVDKNSNEYLIECDTYGKPIVMEYKNVVKAQKDLERMKKLWEYNPGNAVGKATLNEEKVQHELHKKTKRLVEKK